jgi:hypothetical protein
MSGNIAGYSSFDPAVRSVRNNPGPASKSRYNTSDGEATPEDGPVWGGPLAGSIGALDPTGYTADPTAVAVLGGANRLTGPDGKVETVFGGPVPADQGFVAAGKPGLEAVMSGVPGSGIPPGDFQHGLVSMPDRGEPAVGEPGSEDLGAFPAGPSVESHPGLDGSIAAGNIADYYGSFDVAEEGLRGFPATQRVDTSYMPPSGFPEADEPMGGFPELEGSIAVGNLGDYTGDPVNVSTPDAPETPLPASWEHGEFTGIPTDPTIATLGPREGLAALGLTGLDGTVPTGYMPPSPQALGMPGPEEQDDILGGMTFDEEVDLVRDIAEAQPIADWSAFDDVTMYGYGVNLWGPSIGVLNFVNGSGMYLGRIPHVTAGVSPGIDIGSFVRSWDHISMEGFPVAKLSGAIGRPWGGLSLHHVPGTREISVWYDNPVPWSYAKNYTEVSKFWEGVQGPHLQFAADFSLEEDKPLAALESVRTVASWVNQPWNVGVAYFGEPRYAPYAMGWVPDERIDLVSPEAIEEYATVQEAQRFQEALGLDVLPARETIENPRHMEALSDLEMNAALARERLAAQTQSALHNAVPMDDLHRDVGFLNRAVQQIDVREASRDLAAAQEALAQAQEAQRRQQAWADDPAAVPTGLNPGMRQAPQALVEYGGRVAAERVQQAQRAVTEAAGALDRERDLLGLTESVVGAPPVPEAAIREHAARREQEAARQWSAVAGYLADPTNFERIQREEFDGGWGVDAYVGGPGGPHPSVAVGGGAPEPDDYARENAARQQRDAATLQNEQRIQREVLQQP